MGVFAVNDNKLKYSDTARFYIAGAEANTMIGLAKLGVGSQFVSAVGNDAIGDSIQYQLKGEGVGTTFLKTINNQSTGIMTKERGISNSIYIDYFRKNSALNHYKIKGFFNEIFESANILYLTGITPALSQNTYETTIELIKEAKKNNVTVIYDPNYRKKLWEQKEFKNFYMKIEKDVDILLAGSSEAEILFGKKQYSEIAENVQNKLLVIKDGAKGAYFVSKNEKIFKSAYKVPEVDPVGAGDAFAAGLIYGIQTYGIDDITTISKYALGMGAIATTTYGDFYGLPTIKELEQFLNHQINDVER
jgi:2-dehydro-3-deoxygluconokinase